MRNTVVVSDPVKVYERTDNTRYAYFGSAPFKEDDMERELYEFNEGDKVVVVSFFLGMNMINNVRCSLSMKDLII